MTPTTQHCGNSATPSSAQAQSNAGRELLLKILNRTTRNVSLDVATAADSIDRKTPNTAQGADATEVPSLDAVIEKVQGSRSISLSEAAHAVEMLVDSKDPRRSDVVPILLTAIGNDNRYDWTWSHFDSTVSESLDRIVGCVADEELWSLLEAVARGWRGGANVDVQRPLKHPRHCPSAERERWMTLPLDSIPSSICTSDGRSAAEIFPSAGARTAAGRPTA